LIIEHIHIFIHAVIYVDMIGVKGVLLLLTLQVTHVSNSSSSGISGSSSRPRYLSKLFCSSNNSDKCFNLACYSQQPIIGVSCF
jgi:hypothetical protein